jgi:hypothetical protein
VAEFGGSVVSGSGWMVALDVIAAVLAIGVLAAVLRRSRK